uniref:Bacteriorhodopsin-like protein n=1 Tax=viral metagenome TaxID=1070528 RepID=A0A6C0K2U5_9ZZZZ
MSSDGVLQKMDLVSGYSEATNTPQSTSVINGGNTTGKSIVIDDAKKKNENPVRYYVKFSFVITYILLLTTATITFIEAMRTSNPFVRHVLNLETCISVVAGYFYSVFVSQIENFSNKGIEIDWADISKTRYIDWSITTPMMLLALCLVLAQNAKKSVTLRVIGTIVLLNYAMLYIGYAGENKMINKSNAQILGFIPFIFMFSIIFLQFVKSSESTANYVLYAVYLCVWSLYGFVFMLDEAYKNITMNVLDFTAKCFIGLALWAYYTKIIKV